VNFNYIFKGDKKLLTWVNRDYGVAFELPLVLLEKAFRLNDMRDVFLMRHFVSHIFFLISGYYLFLLINHLYKNAFLASIGFLMLVLNPTLYGHSFFNSKDIPFMGMFIISLYYTVKSFSFKSTKNFVVLGVCLALLINMRVMGVLLAFCIAGMLLIDVFLRKERRQDLKFILTVTLSAFVVLYCTWPFLWRNPLVNLANAFVNMSSFRWNLTLLFNGADTFQKDLDWYYILEWFSISNPILYLIVGAMGVLFLLYNAIKNPSRILFNSFIRTNLLFLVCFSGPIVIVAVLHSVVYDCWRQLFFVYPSFVLLAVYGMDTLFKKMKKKLLLLIPIFYFSWILFFMLKNFPFQHVYFNSYFLGKQDEYLRKNFEMDYWGLAYLNSLKYILENDKSECIDVCVDHTACMRSGDLLQLKDRKRIRFMYYNDLKSCTYFITNYRWHPQDYTELKNYSYFKTKVQGNTINEVFKMK
jgi:hypothetical protein